MENEKKGKETSQQKASPFFQLPREIREQIYEKVVVGHDNILHCETREYVEDKLYTFREHLKRHLHHGSLIFGKMAVSLPSLNRPLLQYEFHESLETQFCRARGDLKRYLQDGNLPRLAEWYDAHYVGKAIFVPSLNGLSQSCRTAYIESSHLFYQLNSFKFSDAQDIEKFVGDTQPVHLQQIRKLTLKRFVLNVDNLKFLDSFHSLKALHLKWYCDYWEYGRGGTTKPFMKCLVGAARKLKRLETITVKSQVFSNHLPHFLEMTLDFDHIPGWVLSCQTDYDGPVGPASGWQVVKVTFVLQRVYGPLWRPKEDPKDNAEILEEALPGLFAANSMEPE